MKTTVDAHHALQAWVAEAAAGLRRAADSRTPVTVAGAGSRQASLPMAAAPQVSAAAYRGVVSYEPGDLTITVRSGTPLDELDGTLREEGQMLPFEPPRQAGSTIGGAVALGWSGSRRPFAGSARDHVTGVRMLDGLGRDLRFGGPVVKNVAGFDVPRLLTGSRGVLGLLLEISLRVIPMPDTEHTLCHRCTLHEALALMGTLQVGPGRLSGAAWFGGRLLIRMNGRAGSASPLPANLRAEHWPEEASRAAWRDIVDQKDAFFSPREGRELWRLSVRLGAPPLEGVEASACDWAGALRWVWLSPDDAPRARAWAEAQGGHATAWPPCTPIELPAAQHALQHRLADVFDPRRILQRHRLLAAPTGGC